MAKGLLGSSVGSRGKPSLARRRLRVEPLESRTMLSAAGVFSPELDPGMATPDMVSGIAGADMLANPIEVWSDLGQDAVAAHTNDAGRIDFSKIDPTDQTPATIIRSAVKTMPVVLPSSGAGAGGKADSTVWFKGRVPEDYPGSTQPYSGQIVWQVDGTVEDGIIDLQRVINPAVSVSEFGSVETIDGRWPSRFLIVQPSPDTIDLTFVDGNQRWSSSYMVSGVGSSLEPDFDPDRSQPSSRLPDDPWNRAGTDHDSGRDFKDPEGGFVHILRMDSEARSFSANRATDLNARPPEAAELANLDRLNAVTNSGLVGNVSQAFSMIAEPKLLTEAITPELWENSGRTPSDADGGLAHDTAVLTESSIERSSPAFTSPDQRTDSVLDRTSGVSETSPLVRSAPNGGLAAVFGAHDRFMSSVFGGGTDGDLIDFDWASNSHSGLPGQSEYNPAPRPSWRSDELGSVDPIWKSIGNESEPGTRTRVVQDESPQAGNQAAGHEATGRVEASRALAIDSEEGGMIELVAANLSETDSDRLSVAALEIAAQETTGDGDKIRMDKGVALFQAFELATVPVQGGREASDTPEEPIEVGVPVQAAALTSMNHRPSPKESASADGKSDVPVQAAVLTSTDRRPSPKESASAVRESGRPEYRAAAIPSVVSAAAFLAAIGGFWQARPAAKQDRRPERFDTHHDRDGLTSERRHHRIPDRLPAALVVQYNTPWQL